MEARVGKEAGEAAWRQLMQGLFGTGKDEEFESRREGPADAQQRERSVPIYILGLAIFLLFSVLYQLLLESDAFPLLSGLGKHLSTVIHVPGS